jgi:hypothetical protein
MIDSTAQLQLKAQSELRPGPGGRRGKCGYTAWLRPARGSVPLRSPSGVPPTGAGALLLASAATGHDISIVTRRTRTTRRHRDARKVPPRAGVHPGAGEETRQHRGLVAIEARRRPPDPRLLHRRTTGRSIRPVTDTWCPHRSTGHPPTLTIATTTERCPTGPDNGQPRRPDSPQAIPGMQLEIQRIAHGFWRRRSLHQCVSVCIRG